MQIKSFKFHIFKSFFILVPVWILTTISFIKATNYFFEKQKVDQASAILKIIPTNVLDNLKVSDYEPIHAQLRFIKDSNLFELFAIYDSERYLIYGFGKSILDYLPDDEPGYEVRDSNGVVWGNFTYKINFKDIKVLQAYITIYVSIVFVLLFFFIFLTLKVNIFSSMDNITNTLNLFRLNVEQFLKNPDQDYKKSLMVSENLFRTDEAQKINDLFLSLMDKIRETNEEVLVSRLEQVRMESKYNLSQQVAHDIKSPLAALEIVMDDLKSLPEDTREITLNAVNRIKGIANNLSKQKDDASPKESRKSSTLLSVSLANIVNEKIVENQNKQNVEIILNDESERDSFINIEEEVFLRIVSNLINNSIEAMEKNIQVRVNLSEMNGIVTLSVEDNGRGFPETFLDEGIERGKSIQKVGGQGLGLWYAKEEVEKCGGEFLISNTDNGAKVEIKLKVVEAPKWFQGTINLKNMKNVVIVDDDLSIHDLWKKKLKDMSLNIKIFHSVEEFEAGLEDQKETLYLLDFDLRNSLTGVDLIVKYKLKNSLLVTSNYDVPEVISSCEQNDISILPKQLVPYISAHS